MRRRENRATYANVRREPRRGITRNFLKTPTIHPLISFNYLISSQFTANVRIDISIYDLRESRGIK